MGTNLAGLSRPYVIIGGGFSAAVNHATLRNSAWGRKRIAGRKVVHIWGEEDPFLRHVEHPMGQWPALLALPGYSDRHQSEPHSEFLSSARFAAATAGEYLRLLRRAPPIIGRVTKIEEEHSDRGGFVVHVEGVGAIDAEYVDLCTGPGTASFAKRWTGGPTARREDYDGVHFASAALWREYRRATSTSRIVSAQRFIDKTFSPAPRVLVWGSGALASSCVERAIGASKKVYWVAGHDRIAKSFPPSSRYDHLVRLDGRRLDQRARSLAAKKGYSRGVFGLRTIDGTLLALAPSDGAIEATVLRGTKNTISKIIVDQVAISASSKGKAAALTRQIRDLELITPDDVQHPLARAHSSPFPLGIQNIRGDLRVLGAAAFTHPFLEEAGGEAPLENYVDSLSAQARVDQLRGVTLAAVTIAHANHFFDRRPNHNVNTAHEAELFAILGASKAKRLVEERSARNTPFTDVTELGLDERLAGLVSLRYLQPSYYR